MAGILEIKTAMTETKVGLIKIKAEIIDNGSQAGIIGKQAELK
jgi:hypothetical protein